MPKAYWVVTYRSVKNPEAWQAYAKLAGPALAAAGGRFLIRNKPAKTYEAGLAERVVLVEFDSAATRRSPRTIRRPIRKHSRCSAPAISSATCASSKACNRLPLRRERRFLRSNRHGMRLGEYVEHCTHESANAREARKQPSFRNVRGAKR